MGISKEPYKGTRDLFPKEKRLHNFLFRMMRKTAESFGYEPYDGPLLEEVELYKAKSGQELINEQIYSFKDRGDRFVAIRPEMTPTLARMVAQVHREIPKPIRWYSIPNLMRYENTQRGRLREHWQFNCDIFGANEDMALIEILQLATTFLTNFGATEKDFEVLLNHRELSDYFFSTVFQLDKDKQKVASKIVDNSKKVPKEKTLESFSKLVSSAELIKIFEEYIFETKEVSQILSVINNARRTGLPNLNSKQVEDGTYLYHKIERIFKLIDKANLTKFVHFDPQITRGLDYYTGAVFEIFDKDEKNRRAIAGGGAYANLLQIFNEQPISGIGFGLGDVTLKDFLDVHKLLPDFSKPSIHILATYQVDNPEKVEDALMRCMNFSNDLRKYINVEVELNTINLKKAFTIAEKKGAQVILLMGEDEFDKNQVQLKNLASRHQITIPLDSLVDHKLIFRISEFIKGRNV